jgi:hypothetical protein
MYSYDEWGWLAAVVIPGRQTSDVPPPHGKRTVGEPFPNWTGVAWSIEVYSDPPAPDTRPEQRAVILAQLNAIDADTTKARTLRELWAGRPETLTWLKARDAEAADLRIQLSALSEVKQ